VTPRKQDQEQLVDNIAIGNVEVVFESREVDPSIHILFDMLKGVLSYLANELGSHGVVYEVPVGAEDIASSARRGGALLVRVSVCALLLRL
jgi:hypothetical protein